MNEVKKMIDSKFITDNNTSKVSKTQNPAENRKRHKPTKGLPKV